MVFMPLVDGNHFDFQKIDDRVKEVSSECQKELSDVRISH
jgi:hypothetical protein